MPGVDVRNLHVIYPLLRRVEEIRSEDLADQRLLRQNGKVVGVKALSDVSFELSPGTRLAIVGQNGSGKTTLLRVLAGLVPPDSGRVAITGHLTNFININLGLREHASGHRNITLVGLAAGHSAATVESRREEIAAFTELGDFLDLPVASYSSGMRMRLGFAIATAFEPGILVLDEWLSTGDAAFRTRATERMEQFVDRAGILILASHNRQLLLDNCNRAIRLEHGIIVDDGDVAAVLGS